MIELDKIDNQILRELKCDARIPNVRLAERVGLSPSACLRRVQEMERIGLIKGYRATVDPSFMGHGFLAYMTVGLSDHTKASQKAFEKAVERAPEVVECHNITGTVEYLLRIEVADIAAYKTFHTEVLGTLPQVNAITSFIVLETTKDERG